MGIAHNTTSGITYTRAKQTRKVAYLRSYQSMKKYRAYLVPKCSPECLVFRTASCHCLTRGQRCENKDGRQDGRFLLKNNDDTVVCENIIKLCLILYA